MREEIIKSSDKGALVGAGGIIPRPSITTRTLVYSVRIVTGQDGRFEKAGVPASPFV